jgi:lipopolysaccharide/colanic/teichoic acid biosynthesis glycosyltransferase
MNSIIIHRDSSCAIDNNSLLHFAMSNEPIANLVLNGLCGCLPQRKIPRFGWSHKSRVVCYIPEEYKTEHSAVRQKLMFYKENVPICFTAQRETERNKWSVFSNGRFAAKINMELFDRVLTETKADVLAVNADPKLMAYLEKVRLTPQNKVAGFRRCYSDCAEPAPVPADWPHFFFIKTAVLKQILIDNTLPESFSFFLQKCQSTALMLRAVSIAGVVCDLNTEDGLLNFCISQLSQAHITRDKNQNSNTISPNSKIIGKVLLGKNVHIGPSTIIVGPAIIGNSVKIEENAIIHSSIIGSDVYISENQVVQNRVITRLQRNRESIGQCASNFSKHISYFKFNSNSLKRVNGAYRNWPKLSYAGSLKRIADCSAAIIVLILFAPIMPFIVLAIKLYSPGPVFFKDKRQGQYGKEFQCLKFRSMTVGSESMQDKLKVISEVDGPQFKIVDDPRISAVGNFLRQTYIDEIPQFFNVLLGQMSVVGPRPSPETENTLCPSWRDARLSVRPGITGLWQICRTRVPGKDFQEWIHYDTEYVKRLSLKMDLWICWQTMKRMVGNLIDQI